jgi:hypothetical protein
MDLLRQHSRRIGVDRIEDDDVTRGVEKHPDVVVPSEPVDAVGDFGGLVVLRRGGGYEEQSEQKL